MRNRVARLLLPLFLALPLCGCLQSQAPLIADSVFSDGFAKSYTIAALRLRADADRRIRLERDGDALAEQALDENGRDWTPTGTRYRFAPYAGRTDEAIVQQASGGAYTYLYYRQSGADAYLWSIDCGRIAEAARREIGLSADGSDCRVAQPAQIENAIRAYLATRPDPDYKLTISGGSRSGRLLRGLEREVSESLGGSHALENAAARIGDMASVTGNGSDEAEGDGVTARMAAPLHDSWAALRTGDWPGLARAIVHSWMIFGVIALLAVLLFRSLCRRR